MIEISQEEFKNAPKASRLIDLKIDGSYYFKFILNESAFYFNTFLHSHEIQKVCNLVKDKLIIVVDERFYIFDYYSGRIEMLIRLWSAALELKVYNDIVVLIAEREVYKIDISNSVIHSLESTNDIITNYEFFDNAILIECFDGQKLNISI